MCVSRSVMNSYGPVSSKTKALTHSFCPLCFSVVAFPLVVNQHLFPRCLQECLVTQSAP